MNDEGKTEWHSAAQYLRDNELTHHTGALHEALNEQLRSELRKLVELVLEKPWETERMRYLSTQVQRIKALDAEIREADSDASWRAGGTK